jgi:hypothetical protein
LENSSYTLNSKHSFLPNFPPALHSEIETPKKKKHPTHKDTVSVQLAEEEYEED